MGKFHLRWPRPLLLLGLGVVLAATGAKLALIHRYGTDQPYADQWAAEGMYFLRGPLHYAITPGQLIAPHAEHRPALTRLWVRGLILANGGQWDCFLELVANLLIYAGFLAVAWNWLARLFEGRWLVAVSAFLAVMFALPAAYENFLWGFQSCFLFMLLVGLLHLAGTLGTARPGLRWWLAQLAGLAGIFTIAAGAMSAAALIVLAALELTRGRRKVWAWWTLAANTLLLALALWLLPPGTVAPGSHLTQLGHALIRTGYLLSWPFAGTGWGLLLQVPCAGLLVSWWWDSDRAQASGDGRVVAVGLWVAVTAFAIACGRELTPATIGVRYYDVLLLGLVANGLALARTAGRWTGWRRVVWVAGGLGWLLAVGWGLGAFNQPARLRPLFEYQQSLAVEQRAVIRDFLATDNPARLQAFADRSQRFPHFQITLDFLRDPLVRPLLPPSLTADGHANFLSRFARFVANHWAVIFIAGLLGGLAGAIRLGRRDTKKPPAWFSA